jgi:pantoate--beta-alanine ligase
MKVFDEITRFREWRHKLGGTVGFVPTMGYLHAGHIALVRRAKAENKHVVVSVFVNPAQFGPREDFAAYPRDIERDESLLKEEKVDALLMPDVEEMYPDRYGTWIDVEGITGRLEGASRPGHFRGVATVVAKLFNIVEPARAYFGQKDAQQLAVIKKIVADLNMNLQIVTCPTVRESDGLAMSSRNIYLTKEQRQQATALYRSLTRARELWARGEKNAGTIRLEMTEVIEKEPQADISYISIAHPETLKEMLHRLKAPALVSLAVKFGKTRLIDNIMLE